MRRLTHIGARPVRLLISRLEDFNLAKDGTISGEPNPILF
jgi:hypothetical protein